MRTNRQLLASLTHLREQLIRVPSSVGQQRRHFAQTTRAPNTVCGGGNKKKVCIVGAGPAGFYAAQYVVKHVLDADVDIIEKLPVPFGLVRFGVAPDHPEVKNVITTFTKTAEHPRVRYLGNLSLGQDFTLRDLRDRYHAVILAYGAEHDRPLNIPNETPQTVLSARDFVAWYNGLPGYEHFAPNLHQHKNVAIVGQGNVAIDVARILLSPIDSLERTDITANALRELRASQVQRVYLVGRRGPLQAAFTIKELREMTKLPDVRIRWRTEDFLGVAEEVANLARPRKRLTELMLASVAEQERTAGKRELLPIFLRSPKSIDGHNRLLVSVNQLVGDRAEATVVTELVESDLVMRSIGYKSRSLDKDINFNEGAGYVNNLGGRVLKKMTSTNDNSIDCFENKYEAGLYAIGWLATGPTGVIVTTMNNAFAFANSLCEDFQNKSIDSTSAKPGLSEADLKTKQVVTWDGWKRIDAAEVAGARGTDKPREKILNVESMLKIVKY